MSQSIMKKINLIVNDIEYNLEVDIRESLLDVLRNRLFLTGVKRGCSVGECLSLIHISEPTRLL